MGEGMPDGGLADGYSYLLHQDEETARPERSAMDLPN
jgi:hypothetical protein